MCEIIEHQNEFLAISRLDPPDSVYAHACGGTLNSQNSQEQHVSHTKPSRFLMLSCLGSRDP